MHEQINEGKKLETIIGIASLNEESCMRVSESITNIGPCLRLLVEMIYHTRRILQEMETEELTGTTLQGEIDVACQDIAQIMEALFQKTNGALGALFAQLKD